MQTRLIIHFCISISFLVMAIALLMNGYLLLTSLFTMMFGLSGGVLFTYLSNWRLYENTVQNQY